MIQTEDAVIDGDGLPLDPFYYQPGFASAIGGLGGRTRHVDPGYAFHTDYVEVAEGPCQFIVRFEELKAKIGTLQLRVHMFVDTDSRRLLLANSLRIQFNRLIKNNGEVAIPFDGFRGIRFALHGSVLGETDAQASAISVRLDRPAGAEDHAEQKFLELRNTEYGHDATRADATLIAITAPTLAHPVSQVATLPQLREPAMREWTGMLRLEHAPERERWAAAYVLQALRSYGMLQPGAAGLALAADPGPVARAMEKLGVRCRAAVLPATPEALPGDLVNFDFLWTVDALGGQGIDEAAQFADALMRCVRPGGIAIHVLPFRPGLEQRGPSDGAEAGHLFARGDVERLALIMISRKFEAAQVRIACDEPVLDRSLGVDPVGAFGLVFRKPPITGA